MRSTPMDSVIAGVELHANLIDNLLNHDMLYKPYWAESADIGIIIFISFIVIATVVDTGTMVDFSFTLFLALAIPNILGLFIMSSDVKEYLQDYIKKLKSGELDREAI